MLPYRALPGLYLRRFTADILRDGVVARLRAIGMFPYGALPSLYLRRFRVGYTSPYGVAVRSHTFCMLPYRALPGLYLRRFTVETQDVNMRFLMAQLSF